MSNISYSPLNNSTDKLDVTIPVKESASSSTSNNPIGDSLRKRYIQIAIAVALYWYKEILYHFSLNFIDYLGWFRLLWYF